MAKRIKIGDIVQVLTSEGVAYAQVTHKHKEYGHLIRIFSGFFAKQPKDFGEMVNQSPQFSAFFPVQHAVNQGLLSVVGNAKVSDANMVFPKFRTAARDKDGNRGPWWIWDGEQSEMLKRDLTEEEKAYPVRGIISAPLLVERIEKGYRPETHDV
jgi:hypothetical protein